MKNRFSKIWLLRSGILFFCVTFIWTVSKHVGEEWSFLGKVREYQSSSISKWISGVKKVNIPPYVPLDIVLMDIDPQRYAAKNSSLVRDGFGLESLTTEDGEETWIENGVVYRKHPYTEPAEDKYYSSEFEANIPFDPEVFFQGQADQTQSYRDTMEKVRKDETSASTDGKKIILWYEKKPHVPDTMYVKPLRLCPELPCLITSNKAYMRETSAFLVNGQFINQRIPERDKDQVIVYYQVEAPGRLHWVNGGLNAYREWDDVFNWTMSYRLDSDIVNHYGLIRKRPKPRVRNYGLIMARKTKPIAWIVSNDDAQSKRNDYVRELQKYIDVDVYKGNPNCSRDRDPECAAMISKKYKFYLGFENSFCDNYITEKFYRYFNLDLVVIGRGQNEYSQIAPKETFINTADFKSAKDLAEYLKYLDANDEAYLEILKEKDKYFAVYENYNVFFMGMFLENRYEAVPMCHLCHRLWNLEKYKKSIPSVMDWFENTTCTEPTDLGKDETTTLQQSLTKEKIPQLFASEQTLFGPRRAVKQNRNQQIHKLLKKYTRERNNSKHYTHRDKKQKSIGVPSNIINAPRLPFR